MKLRKGAFVSVIAADIALALISVQGNKVNADTVTSNVKKEKPVQHAIMVKASESDDDGLVG